MPSSSTTATMTQQALPVLRSATARFYTEKLGFTYRHEQDGFAILHRDAITLHFPYCPDKRMVCCRVHVTG